MLDSNTSSITSLILTADSLFEAHFTLTTYELEVLKGSGGESVTPPTGEHSSIAMVSVSAQALEGYEFTGWSDPSGVLVNPNLANTEANMSQATGDITITANFDIGLIQSKSLKSLEETHGLYPLLPVHGSISVFMISMLLLSRAMFSLVGRGTRIQLHLFYWTQVMPTIRYGCEDPSL